MNRSRHPRPGRRRKHPRQPRRSGHAHRPRSPIHQLGLRRCLPRGRQPISAIGSSTDNALAESFNATFKRETLQGRKTQRVGCPPRRAAHRYLRRRHSSLGDRNPIAYETASRTAPTTLLPTA
ncbi:integrase core domain-containing protein [Streptomyces sp. NPDC002159]